MSDLATTDAVSKDGVGQTIHNIVAVHSLVTTAIRWMATEFQSPDSKVVQESVGEIMNQLRKCDTALTNLETFYRHLK